MPRVGKQKNAIGALDAVVVVRSEARRVATWVERGTVPAYVTDLDGPWCAVVPAGPGHAHAPYDDAAVVLAARSTPMTMRPSLAFVPTERDAIVVVHPRSWRSLPRWFVVRRGVGGVRAALPQASIADLLGAAGEGGHPEALERVLAQPHAEPSDLLRGIMAALDVRAGHLLGPERTEPIGARLVEPSAKAVRRFDKHVRAENEERAEIAAQCEVPEVHS